MKTESTTSKIYTLFGTKTCIHKERKSHQLFENLFYNALTPQVV